MKLDELITHLTNLNQAGYDEYEVEIKNNSGNYQALSSLVIDTENKQVRFF